MGWFSWIDDVFESLIKPIRTIIKNPDAAAKRAEKIAKAASDLTAVVLPYAQMVANFTPSVADDILLAAAAEMNSTVQDIINETDQDIRRGRILGLVGRAAKKRLQKLLTEAAGQKIKIGKINLRVPEDVAKIPSDWWDWIAQTLYSAVLKKRDPVALNEPDLPATVEVEAVQPAS